MEITLNNRIEDVPGNAMTVNELLKFKNFTFKLLVIKINGIVIRKNEYDHSVIKEGDIVDVIHLISGG